MVIIELICGHVYSINERPRVDEVCLECHAIRVVVNSWEDQWHSRCRECVYHRAHGFGRKYADAAAAIHHEKTLHSVSVLWYGDAPERIRTLVRETRATKKFLNNPPEDAAPPF